MSLTYLLVAIIGTGGFVGGIVSFVKLKPERESIVVTAAQGAVIVQSSVIEDLANELRRTQEQFAVLESDLRGEVTRMTDELQRVTEERDHLLQENKELVARVDELEAQAAGLAAQVAKLEANGGPTDAAV